MPKLGDCTVANVSDWMSAQMDGFASDSVRMIGTLRKDAQQHVQILLFSATFNEKVKNYALRVVRDNGREDANQVSFLPSALQTTWLLICSSAPNNRRYVSGEHLGWCSHA